MLSIEFMLTSVFIESLILNSFSMKMTSSIKIRESRRPDEKTFVSLWISETATNFDFVAIKALSVFSTVSASTGTGASVAFRFGLVNQAVMSSSIHGGIFRDFRDAKFFRKKISKATYGEAERFR